MKRSNSLQPNLVLSTLILLASMSIVSCGPPVARPPCVELYVRSQNMQGITDAHITILPPSEYAGPSPWVTVSGRSILPFCSGTHSFEVVHPAYRTKRVTYTSPRDRPITDYSFTDQLVVTLDSL